MLGPRVGPGEKASSCSTSMSRIADKAAGCSQGGGRMLARRWRFRSRASQRGRGVGKGGFSACVGPYCSWFIYQISGSLSFVFLWDCGMGDVPLVAVGAKISIGAQRVDSLLAAQASPVFGVVLLLPVPFRI